MILYTPDKGYMLLTKGADNIMIPLILFDDGIERKVE